MSHPPLPVSLLYSQVQKGSKTLQRPLFYIISIYITNDSPPIEYPSQNDTMSADLRRHLPLSLKDNNYWSASSLIAIKGLQYHLGRHSTHWSTYLIHLANLINARSGYTNLPMHRCGSLCWPSVAYLVAQKASLYVI